MHRLLATEDGSLSLQDDETGELYHNRAGAYSEALLNYVRPSGALKRLQAHSKLAILDVCFGLGYNSFVLLQEAIANNATGQISIYAIEKNDSILAVLPAVLSNERFNALSSCFDLAELHLQRQLTVLVNNLQIELNLDINTVQNSLPNFSLPVDYVYHDPFSPRRMPELWTVDIFRRYVAILSARKGAILTYSSAGAVRGGLSEAGFLVRKTTALGGKSGGTIGLIEEGREFDYSQLNEVEAKKMSGSAGIPYTDKGFLLCRQEILNLRQLEQASFKQRIKTSLQTTPPRKRSLR